MITRVYDLSLCRDFFHDHAIHTVAMEALAATYGLTGDTYALYASTDNRQVTDLLGVLGDSGFLALSDSPDIDEWPAFTSFLSLGSLTACKTDADAFLAACDRQGIACETRQADLLEMTQPRLVPSDKRLCETPSLRQMHRLMSRYLSVPQEDDFVADMQARWNHGTGRAVTAEEKGAVIGTACVFFESDTVGFLGGISTDEDYRGQGIASALVSTLCEDLLNRGKRPVLSCTNPAAKRVYESLGFVPTDKKITVIF